MNDRIEIKLVKALEEYNNSSTNAIDAIYDLIDGKKRKSSISTIMTKHKEKLKKIEKYLKMI